MDASRDDARAIHDRLGWEAGNWFAHLLNGELTFLNGGGREEAHFYLRFRGD